MADDRMTGVACEVDHVEGGRCDAPSEYLVTHETWGDVTRACCSAHVQTFVRGWKWAHYNWIRHELAGGCRLDPWIARWLDER